MDTDASNVGFGAVLSQRGEAGERVVAYYSCSLNCPERNYCATLRELLTAVLAVRHFRPYLLGTKFKLRTEHASLTWMLNFCQPEGQVARWLEILQEYDFEVQHRPGRQHASDSEAAAAAFLLAGVSAGCRVARSLLRCLHGTERTQPTHSRAVAALPSRGAHGEDRGVTSWVRSPSQKPAAVLSWSLWITLRSGQRHMRCRIRVLPRRCSD